MEGRWLFQNSMLLYKNVLGTNFHARECELRNAPENETINVYVASQYWCKEDSVLELLGSISLYYYFSHK